jgi:hypothetical protein
VVVTGSGHVNTLKTQRPLRTAAECAEGSQ